MNEMERYSRQVSLKEFGETGQKKLASAKILIVGVGGLGCPALLYLAAAGVGCVGIVDHDYVSLNNLQRQVLFTTKDIGKSKVIVAKEKIKELNPGVEIICHAGRLTNKNALDVIKEYDIIIDGTDNFPTKYLINDACVLSAKPLIYGSVSKFEGQVAVFNVADKKKVRCNYRDLFPYPPVERILNCAEEGVLGFTTGIIGTMQANEAIKLAAAIGEPLINKLLIFNSLNSKSDILEISENSGSYHLPSNEDEFRQTDYDWLCATNSGVEEIDGTQLREMLQQTEILLIDVREFEEEPEIDFKHKRIPLSNFKNNIENITSEKIVCFCQTGKRSFTAAKMLVDHFGQSRKIYNLKGGILML